MSKFPVIFGIDEAGRGALAGPVVAAACLLIDELIGHEGVKDSKQLSPAKRDKIYTWLTDVCPFGVGVADQTEVDSLGILAATEKAMQAAVSKLAENFEPTYLLVDGRDKFWFDYPHSSIIKGDQKEPCISAASILAKVTRDRLMEEEASKFTKYGFERHKGYGTAGHCRMIKKHGPCGLHRLTFLGNILTNEH